MHCFINAFRFLLMASLQIRRSLLEIDGGDTDIKNKLKWQPTAVAHSKQSSFLLARVTEKQFSPKTAYRQNGFCLSGCPTIRPTVSAYFCFPEHRYTFTNEFSIVGLLKRNRTFHRENNFLITHFSHVA